MSRCGGSFGWFDVALCANRLFFDSSEVIVHRTVGMASGRLDFGEAQRMMLEKPVAFALAACVGMTTAVAGGSPSWVAENTIDTIGRAATGNASRLRKTA